MIYDLVINRGNVLSFGDSDSVKAANIGIQDGKISTISNSPLKGKETIDAKGLYVAPGFIDFHSHVNGRPFSGECLLRQGATTTIGGERYFGSDVMPRLETEGFLINQGFYISSSFTLRRAVGLHSPTEEATKTQISNMANLAERFFDFGVFGIHFSLEYIPGTTESELIELLKVAKQHNKVAMIHLRRDGYEALDSLDEIIGVVKKTGASINILHVMYMAGINGLLEEFLRRIDNARKEGCDITADTGVYAALPTYAGSMVFTGDWEKKYGKGASEKQLLISSGIRIGQFCSKELFQYIRREYPTTLISAFLMDDSAIENAIKPDYMMISTNAAYGSHCQGTGHPESSGSYPKLISEYVNQKRILTIEEAIKKITYMPAVRLGLTGKGNIIHGADADITIFDLQKVRPKSNHPCYANPTQPPEGIEYVIIDGHVVLKKGIISPEERFRGKLLKSPG